MERYLVNKSAQSTGEHEVHKTNRDCTNYPLAHNQLDLGYHSSCDDALLEARKNYTNVDGCGICNERCQTK